MTIKEDDEEMYSKILTVMFVNKELNSYNNYYGIHQYDKALDSLLKGLKIYTLQGVPPVSEGSHTGVQ